MSINNWELHKSKHETPCCYQKVRVKILEPGPQYRKCSLCGETNVFVLEPMEMFPNKLRLRWLTDPEIEELHDVEGGVDISDL